MRLLVAICTILALTALVLSAQALDGITLDHVVGLYQGNSDQLECGVPIRIFLRLQNDPGPPADWRVVASRNGFKIYSPDGATWSPGLFVDTVIDYAPVVPVTIFDTTLYGRFVPPSLGWLVWANPAADEVVIYDGGLDVSSFSGEETGADYVSFSGHRQYDGLGVGIFESFNEVAFEIRFELECSSHNLTLCLDSSYFPPGGLWFWSGDGPADVCQPSWDGPHCWTIKADFPDIDGDDIADSVDNCPADYNPLQGDIDNDGAGDVCDVCPLDSLNDIDNDGYCANEDNCPSVYNPNQTDSDFDGVGDSCDQCPGFDDRIDRDGDGIADQCDNCPDLFNLSQSDTDHDGIGNVCDSCPFDPLNDYDQDGHCGDVDNCPSMANPGQEDDNQNGIGDACEDCCQGIRGNTNYDQADLIDITDLVYLVEYMFKSGPEPPCPDEGNVNGAPAPVDILDVTYLIEYMFKDGSAPTACP